MTLVMYHPILDYLILCEFGLRFNYLDEFGPKPFMGDMAPEFYLELGWEVIGVLE